MKSPSGAWCAVPACRALQTGQRSSSRPQTVVGVRWVRVPPGVSPPARIGRTETPIIPRIYTATRMYKGHFYHPCAWCTAPLASYGPPLCGWVGNVCLAQLSCLRSLAPTPLTGLSRVLARIEGVPVRGSPFDACPKSNIPIRQPIWSPWGSAGEAAW